MDNKQLANVLLSAGSKAALDVMLRGAGEEQARQAAIAEVAQFLDEAYPSKPVEPSKATVNLAALIAAEFVRYSVEAVFHNDQKTFDDMMSRIMTLIERFRRQVLDDASRAATDGDAKLEELLRK